MHNIIIVIGQTASGKTELAVKLADLLNTEIISADSRQVYKGLDIGSGKDLDSYEINNKIIPHHLIDIKNPDQEYSLFDFYNDFFNSYREIIKKNKTPILCGGTCLYIHSVISDYKMLKTGVDHELRKYLETLETKELIDKLKSYDIQLHNSTDLTSKKRIVRAIELADFKRKNPDITYEENKIQIEPLIFSPLWQRDKLITRIKERLIKRFNEGMVEEVENLHKNGLSWERLDFFGLEYRYVSFYLQKKITYNELFETLFNRICQFSKRQMTWLRKFEREGYKIQWIPEADFKIAKKIVSLNNIYN